MNRLQNSQLPEIPKALWEEMLEELALIAMERDEEPDGALPDADAIAVATMIRARVATD